MTRAILKPARHVYPIPAVNAILKSLIAHYVNGIQDVRVIQKLVVYALVTQDAGRVIRNTGERV